MLKNDDNTGIVCQSAGLTAIGGEPGADNAIAVCSEIGVDISAHRARRFTAEEIATWDMYFTMSKTHGYILEQAGVPEIRSMFPVI